MIILTRKICAQYIHIAIARYLLRTHSSRTTTYKKNVYVDALANVDALRLTYHAGTPFSGFRAITRRGPHPAQGMNNA